MSDQPYIDKHGDTWREPTKEELKPGHPVREEIEKTLEAWAPNHISDSGRVDSYDEWLERLEGLWAWADEPNTRLELGTDTTVFPYTALKRIAKAVAADLR